MPGQSLENTLPVFTTPQQQITFYADDPTTHKQILTVYNPYDFPVRFRISCTDCSKYSVSNASQGSIRSNHSINLVIHHKAVIPSNIGISDTVRIQLFSDAQIRTGGKKELTVTLLASAPRERPVLPTLEADRFQQLEADTATIGNLRQQPFIHENNGHYLIFKVVAVIVCGIILSLPKDTDESDYPDFIYRPSYQVKLLVGYILGILTALLIQT